MSTRRISELEIRDGLPESGEVLLPICQENTFFPIRAIPFKSLVEALRDGLKKNNAITLIEKDDGSIKFIMEEPNKE